MGIEEAIQWFESELAGGKCSPTCQQCNANEYALEALREKQQAEKNDPLTLEELRKMDGQPAFFVCVDHIHLSMWCIVWVSDIFGKKKVEAHGRTFMVHREFLEDFSYGKHWIAYRSPPDKKC